MEYMKIANSSLLWMACIPGVALCIFQAWLFFARALRDAKQLGVTGEQVRKAAFSSALTSIGPAVVIVAGMVTLLVLLKKRFRRLGLGRILPDLLKIVAAALICAGVCLALNRALPPAMGTGRVFIRLAVCAGTSLITYVAACFILRVKTIRTFAADVLRRGR